MPRLVPVEGGGQLRLVPIEGSMTDAQPLDGGFLENVNAFGLNLSAPGTGQGAQLVETPPVEREEESFFDGFGRGFFNRAGNNLIQAAGLPTGGGLATRILPTVEQFRAFFGGPSLEEQQALADEAPVGTALGSAVGDAATIFAARAPMARARHLFSQFAGKSALKEAPGTFRNLFIRGFNSNAAQGLKRAAGKSAEAGLEGVALGILNDGDPLETGAYAAGLQLVGSGALAFVPTTRGKAGRLFAAGMAGASVIQLIKAFSPVGDDSFAESVKTSFGKIALALFAGGMAGAMGMGRIGGNVGKKFAKDAPEIADFLTTIPRASITSFISNWTQDSRIEPVVTAMVEQPDQFTSGEYRELAQGMFSKAGLSATLDKLSNKATFREKLNQLSGNPVE